MSVRNSIEADFTDANACKFVCGAKLSKSAKYFCSQACDVGTMAYCQGLGRATAVFTGCNGTAA